MNLEYLILSAAIALVALGIGGMLFCHHLFKMVLSLGLAESGSHLLLLLTGYRESSIAPILIGSSAPMVDPVPQALVLTSIVIGVGVQALAVAILIKLYRQYGHLNRNQLLEQMRFEFSRQSGDPTLPAPLNKPIFKK